MLAPACSATAPAAAARYAHNEKKPARKAAAVPTEMLIKGIASVQARLAWVQTAIMLGRAAPAGRAAALVSFIVALYPHICGASSICQPPEQQRTLWGSLPR